MVTTNGCSTPAANSGVVQVSAVDEHDRMVHARWFEPKVTATADDEMPLTQNSPLNVTSVASCVVTCSVAC